MPLSSLSAANPLWQSTRSRKVCQRLIDIRIRAVPDAGPVQEEEDGIRKYLVSYGSRFCCSNQERVVVAVAVVEAVLVLVVVVSFDVVVVVFVWLGSVFVFVEESSSVVVVAVCSSIQVAFKTAVEDVLEETI